MRTDSDGKIDPDSVDGEVRALARALLGAKTHRALREIPLREVQSRYFDILEDNFGKLFSEANRHGASMQQISEFFSSKPSMVSAFSGEVDEFADGLENFWDRYAPVVEAHLGDLKSLKSVFGGDFFPSYTSNIACSVGLYMDTVVLPDPLSRLLTMRSAMAP